MVMLQDCVRLVFSRFFIFAEILEMLKIFGFAPVHWLKKSDYSSLGLSRGKVVSKS